MRPVIPEFRAPPRTIMIHGVTRLLWVWFALCAGFASCLQAQRTVAVALGSRIRVQSQGETTWRVGRLAGVAPDTLRLQSCDSCSAEAYSLSSLSAIQVSMGRTARGRTMLNGALLGTLVGMASGWLWARQETRGCSEGPCGIQYLAIYFFGAGGFAIGATVGVSFRYDDWQPAPIR